MKWKKYGITLSRITRDDIELVRNWRNSEKIQQNMQFREYITPAMQLNWFNSINNINNYYYLIGFQNEYLGLINNKNVDWQKRSSEAGIFIWNESFSYAPILASILLCEIGFYIFQGGNSFINVLKNNKNAIEYNAQLGYDLIKDSGDILTFQLTKENFEVKTKKLREAGLKLSSNDSTMYLILEKHDYESGLAQHIENIKKDFHLNYSCCETEEGKVFSCII